MERQASGIFHLSRSVLLVYLSFPFSFLSPVFSSSTTTTTTIPPPSATNRTASLYFFSNEKPMQMRVLEYSCSDGNRKNSIVEIVPLRFPPLRPLFVVFSLRFFFFLSFSPPDFFPLFPPVFNNTTSRGRKPRTVSIARIMSRAALSLSLLDIG